MYINTKLPYIQFIFTIRKNVTFINKCIQEGSDIDLCLILVNRDDELENSIIRMAKEISNDIDIDLVFYSEEIFNKYKDINGSFVRKVLQGIKLW